MEKEKHKSQKLQQVKEAWKRNLEFWLSFFYVRSKSSLMNLILWLWSGCQSEWTCPNDGPQRGQISCFSVLPGPPFSLRILPGSLGQRNYLEQNTVESHPKYFPGVSSSLPGPEFGHPRECAQRCMSVEVLRPGSRRNAECHSGDTQSTKVGHSGNPKQLVAYTNCKG